MSMSVYSEYYVDVVMCIDGTASMKPIIDEIKESVLLFNAKFTDAMEEINKHIAQLRIKVIVFRDFN